MDTSSHSPVSSWIDGQLLGFDLETTGVSVTGEDVPVSVAFVMAEHRRIIKRVSFLVDPPRDIPAEATAVHGITTERARAEGIAIWDAAKRISTVLGNATAAGVPIVGMNVSFDLSMSATLCASLGVPGPESFPLLVADVLVLDKQFDRYRKGSRKLVDLCAHYGVELTDAHDAAADAAGALKVLGRLATRYSRIAETPIAQLTEHQAHWHRQQIRHLSKYRVSQGDSPLDPSEEGWPLRGAAA